MTSLKKNNQNRGYTNRGYTNRGYTNRDYTNRGYTNRGYANRGYIALISTLIISLILIGLTFTLSASGFFTRFNVLDREYKRISLGLAESCANVALLEIAKDPNYDPNTPGAKKNIPVGTGTNFCTINSVSYDSDHKIATIDTQASYNGAFSKMQITSTVTPGQPYISPSASADCADTVMMLDRTAQMFHQNDAPENLAAAAKSFLDYCNKISPAPQIGVGSFGGLYANEAQIPDGSSSQPASGRLTSTYGSDVPQSGLYETISLMMASPGGGEGTSTISDAIIAAQNELNSTRHNPECKKVLIFFSESKSGVKASVVETAKMAKEDGIEIYSIHFGDNNYRELSSEISTGSLNDPESFSINDAGESTTQTVIDAENNDGDHFFISPTSAQLSTIVNIISTIIYPPPNISIDSWRENP